MTTEGITIDSLTPLTIFDPNIIFYVVCNEIDYKISGNDLLTLLSQNLEAGQLPSTVITETKLELALNNFVSSSALSTALLSFVNEEALTGALEPLVTTAEMNAEFSSRLREVLVAPKTLYVRKDGSNSNSGLTNDASGAFLTIQHAVNKAATYDFNYIPSNIVTIQIGPGIYEENLTLIPLVNPGSTFIDDSSKAKVKLLGDIATPTNVTIKPPMQDRNGISCNGQKAQYGFQGIKIDCSLFPSWNSVIYATDGAEIELKDLVLLSANGAYGFVAYGNGTVITYSWSPFTVEGSGWCLMQASNNSEIRFTPSVINAINIPVFSKTLIADDGSKIIFSTGSLVGTATGKKYQVDNLSTISTLGAGESKIPGSTAGTIDASSRSYV